VDEDDWLHGYGVAVDAEVRKASKRTSAMTKETGRLVICGLAAALILYTISSLFGRHYYRENFGVCMTYGLLKTPICRSWTLQAVFQALAICVAAVVGWVYNERRSIK
jgi:hypothetical protein